MATSTATPTLRFRHVCNDCGGAVKHVDRLKGFAHLDGRVHPDGSRITTNVRAERV